MYSCQRNSYLQSIYSTVNPRTLNRCVDQARGTKHEPYDLEPPLQRLSSEHPCLPLENIDPTRRPVAFGRWAMPILRRELHSPHIDICLQALTTICDLCHDPERAFEAITLKVTDRLADLLLSENKHIRERTCLALKVLASYAEAKEQIVKNPILLDNISFVVEDPVDEVRIKLASCLELLARTWTTADYLVDYGYVQIILENVVKEIDQIAIIHLNTLQHLMYGHGKDIAIEIYGFQTLLKLLEHDNKDIRKGALDCLKIMTSTPFAKQLALDHSLLESCNVLLYHDEQEIYTAAVSVIMFCTIRTKAKIIATEIKNLALKILALSRNGLNPTLQLYCFKALTNLAEHPVVRRTLLKNHLDEIKSIWVEHDEHLKRYKDDLLNVICWTPHGGPPEED